MFLVVSIEGRYPIKRVHPCSNREELFAFLRDKLPYNAGNQVIRVTFESVDPIKIANI